MNVIVANEQENILSNLDCDVIKNINGSFSSQEMIEMFKDFFFSKMILDVTALRDYEHINSYKDLISVLDPNKIIFFIKDKSSLCKPEFLSELIKNGIYNFTTNIEGINYLLKKTNTIKDVEHILKMVKPNNKISNNKEEYNDIPMYNDNLSDISGKKIIIGLKNVTEHAGSTTLSYIMKKELEKIHGKNSIECIEINKDDYKLFNDKNMISIKEEELTTTLNKLNKKIIIIDFNNLNNAKLCDEMIYLLEPSTIKLNKLIQHNKIVFQQLKGKKVILNKSLLNSNDVHEFESEAGINVFYNMPPLDERKSNDIIKNLFAKLGLLGGNIQKDNKIFGLFRR